MSVGIPSRATTSSCRRVPEIDLSNGGSNRERSTRIALRIPRERRSTLTGVPLYKLKCCAEVESALVYQRPEQHYFTESL
jgi:hypothetical protein